MFTAEAVLEFFSLFLSYLQGKDLVLSGKLSDRGRKDNYTYPILGNFKGHFQMHCVLESMNQEKCSICVLFYSAGTPFSGLKKHDFSKQNKRKKGIFCFFGRETKNSESIRKRIGFLSRHLPQQRNRMSET